MSWVWLVSLQPGEEGRGVTLWWSPWLGNQGLSGGKGGARCKGPPSVLHKLTLDLPNPAFSKGLGGSQKQEGSHTMGRR